MEELDVVNGVVRRVYAGIGSRETPRPVLHLMAGVAVRLALADIALRSGGADGADSAFEWGADQVDAGLKQIFLPWAGFNKRRSPFDQPTEAMRDLAAAHHPAWGRLTSAARKLHARNSAQILGPALECPARDVICWTPGGASVGGTGQALRLAAAYGVPVINLGAERWRGAASDDVAHAALSIILARPGASAALPRVLNKRQADAVADAALIDRTTPLGNPYAIGRDGTRLAVVVKYKRWLAAQPRLKTRIEDLRGRDLLCWCAPKLCHGNVLLPLANRPV